MDNRLLIPAAVIAAGLIAGFGPRLLDSYNQSVADDSLQCHAYRAQVSLDNLKTLRGEFADHEATDRERVRAGCS